MSPTEFAHRHKWIYWSAIALLVALVIAGLIRYSSVKRTAETSKKADQLSQELVKAGFPAPDKDTSERLFGTDGGQVCENPGGALTKALSRIEQFSNGATGPGMRPVIGDSRVVEAERIVIQVYCPDELDDFDDAVEDYETDETVRR
ncbi:hypothetical protein [Streptomyces sp. NPDC048623]|uniref:hypothetical protein n=1 Tax=Streptomyces sp. NPDC048623 TaxID=3155761 RepID=UPI003420F1E4